MKLNFSKNKTHSGRGQRGIVIVAILLIIGSGIPSTSAQLGSRKRITSLQSGQTASGTRVSVFSDSSLSDYEAFRRGDRFYIKVPLASFEAPKPNLRGDGFEDIQVQRVGDSIVVSFKLQPGANARVDQRSNRLDVYFTTQNKIARSTTPNAEPTRTSSNSVPGIVTLDTARNQQVQRNPNAAGPMPPDTPGGNRPRVATQQPVAYREDYEPASQRSQSQASSINEPSSRANTRSTETTSSTRSETTPKPEADRVASSSNSTTTAIPVPSSTPTHQPSTSATPYSPYSTRPAVSSNSTNSASGWAKRLDQAKQWVSMNRTVAAIGAGGLLGLILLAVALLYRRRRKAPPAKHKKVPGVQPKYSPANELDDLRSDFGDEEYETVFDDYAVEAAGSKPNVGVRSEDELPSAGGSQQWADMFADLNEELNEPELPATEPITGSYAPATPTMSVNAMKHDEYEREVFEL